MPISEYLNLVSHCNTTTTMYGILGTGGVLLPFWAQSDFVKGLICTRYVADVHIPQVTFLSHTKLL